MLFRKEILAGWITSRMLICSVSAPYQLRIFSVQRKVPLNGVDTEQVYFGYAFEQDLPKNNPADGYRNCIHAYQFYICMYLFSVFYLYWQKYAYLGWDSLAIFACGKETIKNKR